MVWLRRTGCASRRKKPPITHIRGHVINPVVDIANDVQQPRITGPTAVQRRHGGDDIEPAGSVPS